MNWSSLVSMVVAAALFVAVSGLPRLATAQHAPGYVAPAGPHTQEHLWKPYDGGTIAIQALVSVGTLLVMGMAAVFLVALAWGNNSIAGPLMVATVLAVPFVVPLGVNLGGIAMGGTSHYPGALLGALLGTIALFVSAYAVSLIQSESAGFFGMIAVPLFIGGGSIVGYHIAADYEHNVIAPRVHVAPVVDARGQIDGASVRLGFSF
ncbi:MAG: hypothetical protein H0U74_11225 [Bradymonadaceae bacterium]|nr:hypothetical protein [Lujinxingiaceae bacterium]